MGRDGADVLEAEKLSFDMNKLSMMNDSDALDEVGRHLPGGERRRLAPRGEEHAPRALDEVVDLLVHLIPGMPLNPGRPDVPATRPEPDQHDPDDPVGNRGLLQPTRPRRAANDVLIVDL